MHWHESLSSTLLPGLRVHKMTLRKFTNTILSVVSIAPQAHAKVALEELYSVVDSLGTMNPDNLFIVSNYFHLYNFSNIRPNMSPASHTTIATRSSGMPIIPSLPHILAGLIICSCCFCWFTDRDSNARHLIKWLLGDCDRAWVPYRLC